MAKFKVGDKVLVTGGGCRKIWNSKMPEFVGCVGSVVAIDTDNTCKVLFQNGSAWWFNFDNLHVAKAVSELRTAKVPVRIIQRMIAENAQAIHTLEVIKRHAETEDLFIHIRKQLKKLVETQTALKRSLAGVSHV